MSHSDIDHTCEHEDGWDTHPTGWELICGSVLFGAALTGIGLWLLGAL